MFDLNYFDMVRTFVWLMEQPTVNLDLYCNKSKASGYARLLYADKYKKIANMSKLLRYYIAEIYDLPHSDICPVFLEKFY